MRGEMRMTGERARQPKAILAPHTGCWRRTIASEPRVRASCSESNRRPVMDGGLSGTVPPRPCLNGLTITRFAQCFRSDALELLPHYTPREGWYAGPGRGLAPARTALAGLFHLLKIGLKSKRRPGNTSSASTTAVGFGLLLAFLLRLLAASTSAAAAAKDADASIKREEADVTNLGIYGLRLDVPRAMRHRNANIARTVYCRLDTRSRSLVAGCDSMRVDDFGETPKHVSSTRPIF